MTSIFGPLTNRTYAALFGAHVIGLIGNGLTTVALALLAYELAGETAGTVLGTALTLKMVAYVGFGTLGGVIARRFARRSLLVSLCAARGALLLLMVVASATWHLYGLIFVLSVSAALFTPIFQATIPDVLSDEGEYTRALSLSRLAYDLENLLSPATAALLLGVLPFDGLFIIAGACFVLASCLVWVAGQLPNEQSKDETGLQVVTLGLRHYFTSPELRALLALSFAVAAGGAMVIVNTVVYVRVGLGGTEPQVALALAAFGAGSMVAAFSLPALLERYPDRSVLLVGGLTISLSLSAGLSSPAYVVLLAIWFLLGAATSLIQIPAGRLITRASDSGMQPSLFAAHFVLTHACWMICYPLAGWTAKESFTLSFALLALLAVCALACAVAAWRPSETVAPRA